MSFEKFTWKDRISQYPNRRTLSNIDTGSDSIVEIYRNEGTIAEEGTAFSASNMNNLEQRISKAIFYATPVEIYSSSSGTSSDFQLTAPYNDYSIIKVYFGLVSQNTVYGYSELLTSLGNRLTLTLQFLDKDSSSDSLPTLVYVASTFLNFSGRSASFNDKYVALIRNGSTNFSKNNDALRVFKVMGYSK